MDLLATAGRVFDHLCNSLAVLAAALIFATFILVNSEVFSRLLTGRSILWVIEVSEYSLLFITFLGATWLLRHGGHIRVELTLSRLNPRAQAAGKAINSIICAIASLVITYAGLRVTWEYLQTGYVTSSALTPPGFIIVSIIPIGSFLLFIQFSRMAYGWFGKWKDVASPLNEGQEG